MNKQQLSFDELVFEGRNKEFGAFALRKIYFNNVGYALIISLSVVSLALAGPIIYKILKSDATEEIEETKEVSIELLAPPPIDQLEKPIVIDVSTPKVNMVKFLAPEIVPDEQVPQNDEKIATNEELKDAIIGNVTEVSDISTTNSGSQDNIANLPLEEDQVFDQSAIEVWPEFPGGMTAFTKYLKKKLSYTRIAEEKAIEGKIFISFVVSKDGKINDVKVVKGLGYGLDENAIAAIRDMPAWNPGQHNGRSVSVRYNMPVSYKLPRD